MPARVVRACWNAGTLLGPGWERYSRMCGRFAMSGWVEGGRTGPGCQTSDAAAGLQGSGATPAVSGARRIYIYGAWCPYVCVDASVQWRVPLATHPRGHTRETRTAVSSGERRRGVTQHACPSTEQRYLYRETHGETHISLIYYIIIILSQRYLYTSVWSLVSLSRTSLLVLPLFFLSFPGFHLSERTGRSQARGLPVDVLAYQAPGVPCGRRCREQLAHRAVLRAHEAHRHLAIRSL